MRLIERPSFFRTNIWLSAWKAAWIDSSVKVNDLIVEQDCPLPFYVAQRYLYNLLPLNCAYPFGVTSPFLLSLRGEYFQLPEDLLDSPDSWRLQWDAFNKHKWSLAFFPDILNRSRDFQLLKRYAESEGYTVIEGDAELSYGVGVDVEFEQYLSQLGKNTKTKLYNKRSKLRSYGDIKVTNMWPDYNGFIAILNAFHEKRWGRPCYSGNNLIFVMQMLERVKSENIVVDLSILSLDNKPISAVFDIHYGSRVYNFQSGFNADIISNISIGIIHLGYQIEAACKNPTISYYDFMAGSGKNAEYKRSIATETSEFVTIKIIRDPWLKLLYKLNLWICKVKRYF